MLAVCACSALVKAEGVEPPSNTYVFQQTLTNARYGARTRMCLCARARSVFESHNLICLPVVPGPPFECVDTIERINRT
jgi:hypothetical protein